MKTFFATLIFIASFTAINAQDFTLTADSMRKDTQGEATFCSIDFKNHMTNNTTADLPPYHWKIILLDLRAGWSLCQFCDNASCRENNENPPPVWVTAPYQEIVAGTILVGNKGLLEPKFDVPVDGENGCGVLKVRVWTDNTVDTATFIVCKNPLGISKIAINNSKVNIYPNPANDNILVYCEKSLSAANLSIVSITGQTVNKRAIDKNKEANSIDISTLSKGTYMIRLTDDKGQLITSRKFIKE